MIRSKGRGVTLVELLIALALAGLLLTLIGGLLASARAAESSLGGSVEPRAALGLAAELVREEISLSGHLPYGSTAAEVGDMDTSVDLQSAALVVTANGGASDSGDAIRVWFVDDRLASGPVIRDLSFSTAVDSRGEAQLYRRSGVSSARQPLVAGIASLRVGAYLDASGLQVVGPALAGAAPLSEVRGVVLELFAPTGENRTVLIELPSRPTLRFEP